MKESVRSAFLLLLARTGNPTAAAAFSGVSPDEVERWKEDSSFIAQYDRAVAESCDWLRFWAWKRAVEGADIPYFFQGRQVGVKRIPSDSLLLWFLKVHLSGNSQAGEAGEPSAQHLARVLEQRLAALAEADGPGPPEDADKPADSKRD